VKVFIFTDNKDPEKNFNLTKNKSAFEILFFPYEEMRKVVKNNTEPAIVYLDLKNQEETYCKDIKYLLSKENIYTGVIDPGGIITDPGALFLSGITDYISGKNCSELPNEKRLKAVYEYLEQFRADFTKSAVYGSVRKNKDESYITASNWKEIAEGREYTFSLLYIEFDDKEELVKKHNNVNLSQALAIFKSYIERHITPYNGKIWMWNDFGGIILFPYAGGKCTCVVSAFKIMLYKLLFDAEESIFPHYVSFRMAMHLGNCVYHTDETGNIISDTINSIFHLGKIFTEAGNMTITEEIMDKLPDQLKEYFRLVGKYEDRLIYKMLRLQFQVNP